MTTTSVSDLAARSYITEISFCRILVVVLIALTSWEGYSQLPEGVSWRAAQKQPAEWYSSTEALRIAENVVLYQNNNGGWLKNIDMARKLNDQEISHLKKEKSRPSGTTIDNGSTFTQMKYLARVYQASGKEEFKEAFNKGLDFLLEAQYENGGWPQFYPIRQGYYEHITYNDNAMIGVMNLLRDIVKGEELYSFVGSSDRERARSAIEKGLEIILKTQVVVDGKLTAWCAQHDKDNLTAAKARSYELPSLSGSESVGIVRYLMGIEQPSEAVRTAIESAVSWFQEVKIEGERLVRIKNDSLPKGADIIVVKDKDAGPLWARFYEIGTNRPIYMGRDGIKKYRLEEIDHERRNNYSYLGKYAEQLLEKDYPEWKKRI